jgi:hypothetical protein
VGDNNGARPIRVEQVRASIRKSGWSEATYQLGVQFVTEELRRRFGRRQPGAHEVRHALEAICAEFQIPPGMSIEVAETDPYPGIQIIAPDRSDERLVKALRAGLDKFVQELFQPF